MMNPQYPPPGQNNNAPSNPMGFPPSDFNGVNANYSPMPPNGPQKTFDQNDMTQKMQNININGPGVGIPSTQLPPGPGQFPPGAYPPTSNFGQLPPGQRPPGGITGRPPVSGAQFPPGAKPSTPGPIAPVSQGFGAPPGQQQNSQFPPGPMQRPPSAQQSGPPQMSQGPGQMPQGPGQMPQGPGQMLQGPGQMPPSSLGGMPSQSQPGLPGQPGLPLHGSQKPMGPPQGQGLPPQPNQSLPPQGPPLSQAGPLPSSSGMPSQPGTMPAHPGQSRVTRLPGQLPSQSGQPGMPQPGQFQSSPQQPGQPGLPPQPLQSGFQQPGQMQSQPRLPPQPGPPGQPGQMPGQGLPPQPGQMQGGFPQQLSQPGFLQQPGQPPQQGQLGFPSQPGQAGLPPQMPGQSSYMPGQPGLPTQPGLPPQPGQMPGQPPVPGQPGFQQAQMPGMPHMPPPLTQQRQQFSGMPPAQAGPPGPPGPPTSGAYPGMPPMPGQQPGFGQPASGYPAQYQSAFPGQQPSYPGQQYQQPQKRLDPDQMPSPIQVMSDDQNNRGGIFVTNEKGLVPPLVTTDFTVDDKGNASPRYIRSSMYTVPVTADLLKQTAMPFCLVLAPMAEPVGTEPPPPLLDFAALTGSPTMGPVRCARCKAYICPNMKFVDAGRHFHCAFCKATTEVPMEYTQYINSMQQYGRVPAEMALGAYEIVATKEYCRNNILPNPPAVVFVIDVSYNSIKSGLLDTICENIMDIIAAMPRDEQTGKSWTRVGFITYSSTVHFYNIKGTLAQPQMMSVGDVADMFVPLLEGFLAYPEESGAVLQALLQQLPTICRDNKETETILLPAVQAGLEALKAADTSGQLLVFHTSLPTYNAPGKLINREDRKLLGTDKEKTILNPASTAYNEVGQACSAAGVSVEMFVCNQSYVDTATIGQLARLTGGQLRKYTYFTSEVDGPRLVWDVRRVVTRPTAFDAVMRVRTSTGVRATDFYGHMFMSNTTDVELAAVDSDKAIGIEIKHDDKLTAEDGVYIQAALLYTHRCGQRRLRILNLALSVAHQLADVYRSMELDTCINFLTKQAVWALREHAPRQVREGLSTRCARSLATYRRHCASPSSAGQLVLPESMKLLPLYTSCMLRSDAIAGGPDISCDDRSCAMYRALTADVLTSVVYTYPRLLPLHRLTEVPHAPLRATMEKMRDQGVYLLENGVHILIWVGSQASPEFVNDVFGVPSAQQVDTQVTELPELETAASAAVRQLVHDTRVLRRSAMRLTVMRQHDKMEAVLRHFLVEDRGVDGSTSYVDYLCHVHKEIRALL